jgi:hydrogenase nickel incorporation protein HypA/HybF
MHELSLCRSILGIVDRARDGRPVEVVELQVGHLRQVVPASLESNWRLLTADGPLAGSRLEIEHVPVRLACRTCGADTTLGRSLVLACAGCGARDVDLTAGEELVVTALRLAGTAGASPSRAEEH